MSQTSIIFGALLVGFVVFITLRGELSAYAAVLTGSGATNTATGAPIGTAV